MGAAGPVPAVPVGEVRLPAVVDDDASVPGYDPDAVDGPASALSVRPPARDRPAGADVDPVVRSVHPQRGPVHVGNGVVPESGRPAIAWIMAAVRTGGTIRAQSGWTAQAAMPGPYRRGPGMVSGNAPVVRAPQRGQSLTPATTRRSRRRCRPRRAPRARSIRFRSGRGHTRGTRTRFRDGDRAQVARVRPARLRPPAAGALSGAPRDPVPVPARRRQAGVARGPPRRPPGSTATRRSRSMKRTLTVSTVSTVSAPAPPLRLMAAAPGSAVLQPPGRQCIGVPVRESGTAATRSTLHQAGFSGKGGGSYRRSIDTRSIFRSLAIRNHCADSPPFHSTQPLRAGRARLLRVSALAMERSRFAAQAPIPRTNS